MNTGSNTGLRERIVSQNHNSIYSLYSYMRILTELRKRQKSVRKQIYCWKFDLKLNYKAY